MKGKKRILTGIVAVALLMAFGAGGMSLYAYLADTDDGINVITIGDVHINAWEPSFPTLDEDKDGVPDDCELVIPYEEISKDPRIQNTGTNDALVFFKVTVPVELITAIDDEGNRLDEELKDLFWFKQKDDFESFHQNNWNSAWIELTEADHKFVDNPGCNIEGRGYTYIFGYHTRIRGGETTATLFDKVQNKKYGSRTISANEKETVILEAYAVQADSIYRDGTKLVTNGEISEEDLTYVYRVFINQNKKE